MSAMTAIPHSPSAVTLSPSPVSRHESELRRHVAQCRAGRSRWFSAAAWMERLHGALAPRFATTVVAAAGLIWLTVIWP